VIDNSSSIVDLKAESDAMKVYDALKSDKRLKEKFDVQLYAFDSDFSLADTISFSGTQTNIETVAKSLKSIYRSKSYPTVLISDGNQTTGSDFVYAFERSNMVYPVVVGDTTTFPDLKISQLNVNKYAFLRNKFPAEVFLQYAGNKTVNAVFSISGANGSLVKESVTFSPAKRSAVVNVLLPADKTGIQLFKASLTSPEQEKNTYNNHKNFAVEVIDQKTEVAIISSLNHPDIAALKRAIESNAQRKVTIVNPQNVSNLGDYNMMILYQPTIEFRQVLEQNKGAKINTLIVTGPSTDYSLLNNIQSHLSFKMSGQREDYLADFSEQFNLFAAEDIGFGVLPPLQNAFGTVVTQPDVNVLLASKIRNIDTGAPLVAFVENAGTRTGFILGENIWKWRLQSHINHNSFEKFDGFIDKTIQYLTSDNKRKSLVVNHERFYNSGDPIEITAQYFNKNYEFDEKAQLSISVTNNKTKEIRKYDLLKGSNAFKADLEGLPAGQYSFTVLEQVSKNKYTAGFEILDFDIEKQFVNPDVSRMLQLARQTGGTMYLPDQVESLIKTLLDNDSYKAVQKGTIKKLPLIDSVLLLVVIAISLACEWFIRKYNGML
jgi:hypothetical protein